MASQCVAEPLEQEAQPQQVPANPQPAVQDPQQMDYDFVEQPSQDFFCPVTLELLIEPHLTICCGNHLSQEAANRLQRDGKPCPMCKEPQLNTVANKHFKRKVNEIQAHCPHKKSGCEWVGGVNEVKQHSDSCPKRPWQCQYCEFASTYDIGPNEHTPKCSKYPVVCPNSCEIVSVPRCDLEAHLMVCPLQPVACEYAEVGCDVKVPCRDLARHMEESQQQHLLSATLLNLRLTRENTEEKNRLLRMIEEKDKMIKERGEEHKKQLKEKDQTIADLQTQLKQVQESLEAKIANLQQQVVKYGEDTQEHLKQQDKHVEGMFIRTGVIPYELKVQGFTLHEFTLTDFNKCQAKGSDGDWYSESFYSHPGGYKFKLKVVTNGYSSQPNVRGIYVSICFCNERGDHDDKLDWPVTATVHVQLLNQLRDHNHHEVTSSVAWRKGLCGYRGHIYKFIKIIDLGLSAAKKTQYLKNDCLQFRVYIKATKSK